MIAKTYYVENPARLSSRLNQMVVEFSGNEGEKQEHTRPLEDAGLLMLDHAQILLSVPLLRACIQNKVCMVVCDDKHHPAGLMVPFEGNALGGGRMRAQMEAGKPLKKRLWQLTVAAKIRNQAFVLKKFRKPYKPLLEACGKVRSGDAGNLEARAAAYYWRKLFSEYPDFRRDRYGDCPNPALNYCYAVLRAMVARALVGSGLFPFMGIHHKNQFNSFCLADDVMEPFRPYADDWVKEIGLRNPSEFQEGELSRELRAECLTLLNRDVRLEGDRKPLQVAVHAVCAGLAKCFETGSASHLIFPEYE
ncbi:MAG: CRISPR-associated endonuclease Cas1 [Saprospiraceae bacterium]|jgi:CRISPR-associated protein Cas1|nr:CRISPR-associated endonuclease Cas1 [Saprospiraceae bacterium]